MTPIYFPFTYISKPVLDRLTDCFGKIAVYQCSRFGIPKPMTAWEKSGRIDIRIPVEGDEETLENLFGDFKAWADLHQGGELSLLKTQAGKIPFFDEHASSQIALNIKRRDSKTSSRQKSRQLLHARLFLLMAQAHDLQNDLLRQDFKSLESMEKHMMRELTGDTVSAASDSETSQPALDQTDPHMLEARVDAWTRILLHDHRQAGLYITSSRAVVEYLLDNAPEAKIPANIDDFFVLEKHMEKDENRQHRLLNHLEAVATGTASAPTTPIPIALTGNAKHEKEGFYFFIIPDISPRRFFTRYLTSSADPPLTEAPVKAVKNTLLCWFSV
jgi:hypothetical protein